MNIHSADKNTLDEAAETHGQLLIAEILVGVLGGAAIMAISAIPVVPEHHKVFDFGAILFAAGLASAAITFSRQRTVETEMTRRDSSQDKYVPGN